MNIYPPRSGLDLKVLRVQNRVKAMQIAQGMGVSASRVSSIEREGLVSADVTRRYIEALDTCRASSASQTAPEVA